MVDTIDEKVIFIGLGVLTVAAFAGGMWLISSDNHKKAEFKQKAIEVSEQIESKMMIDIKEQSSIELSDDFSIDLTAINLQDGKGRVNNGEQALNLYAISNENVAFKTTYDLTDEQLSVLTKGGSEKAMIEALSEVFSQLELSHLETRDLEAMSLGLEEEKDFKNIAKAFGAAHKTNNLIKQDYELTPDFFMPVFSTVDVNEIDGVKTATLTIEGLEYHGKTTPNIGMGYAAGTVAYETTGSRALGYAMGISTAYATGFKHNNVYSRTEEVTVVLTDEQANMTEQEIREYIVNGMLTKSIEFSNETVAYSNNLSKNSNKAYSKITDQEMSR